MSKEKVREIYTAIEGKDLEKAEALRNKAHISDIIEFSDTYELYILQKHNLLYSFSYRALEDQNAKVYNTLAQEKDAQVAGNELLTPEPQLLRGRANLT